MSAQQERKVFALSKVTAAIERQIRQATLNTAVWIRAEISQIQFHHGSGHCYIELVEQEADSIKAKMRATIWASTLSGIRDELGDDFKNVLKQGVEIVFRGLVKFHPVHGLQINISAVDLEFNLGQLEKRKRETIARLKKEGLLEQNAQLKLPTIVQRVALIASENTAGYNDFFKQLDHNEQGYKVHVTHFHAQVQGDGAAEQMRLRLLNIPFDQFDAICLIRAAVLN
jgi:exodeoxyribonuclease VII large subunit